MSKMLMSLLLAMLAAVASSPVAATAQVSDVVLIDGKSYALNTNPLGAHLASLGEKAPKFDSPHTANWRGYVATWELADGKLYLRKVEGYRDAPARDTDSDTDDGIPIVDGMAELFPSRNDVVATWYTGALIVPDGEMVDYVHMGYGSTYANYIVSIVRNGMETERRRLSRKQFERYRDEKFEKYKQTEQYKRQFAESKSRARAMNDRQIEEFIRQFEAERYLSAL